MRKNKQKTWHPGVQWKDEAPVGLPYVRNGTELLMAKISRWMCSEIRWPGFKLSVSVCVMWMKILTPLRMVRCFEGLQGCKLCSASLVIRYLQWCSKAYIICYRCILEYCMQMWSSHLFLLRRLFRHEEYFTDITFHELLPELSSAVVGRR